MPSNSLQAYAAIWDTTTNQAKPLSGAFYDSALRNGHLVFPGEVGQETAKRHPPYIKGQVLAVEPRLYHFLADLPSRLVFEGPFGHWTWTGQTQQSRPFVRLLKATLHPVAAICLAAAGPYAILEHKQLHISRNCGVLSCCNPKHYTLTWWGEDGEYKRTPKYNFPINITTFVHRCPPLQDILASSLISLQDLPTMWWIDQLTALHEAGHPSISWWEDGRRDPWANLWLEDTIAAQGAEPMAVPPAHWLTTPAARDSGALVTGPQMPRPLPLPSQIQRQGEADLGMTKEAVLEALFGRKDGGGGS